MKKTLLLSMLVLFTGLTAAQNFTEEPVLGEEDANLTIVMYEDYECPYCKEFETNTFPQIKENYVDTGKAKIVWKDFPLPARIHPWAMDAARTMECVYRQDSEAFWNIKDTVYANQADISTSNVVEKIKGYASEQGVNASSVQTCLDSGNPREEIEGDKQDASRLGIRGTPGVMVGDQKVVGARPYSRFKTVIENQLAGEGSGDSAPVAPDSPGSETGNGGGTAANQTAEVGGDSGSSGSLDQIGQVLINLIRGLFMQ